MDFIKREEAKRKNNIKFREKRKASKYKQNFEEEPDEIDSDLDEMITGQY